MTTSSLSDDLFEDARWIRHVEDALAIRSLSERGCAISFSNGSANHVVNLNAACIPTGMRGQLFLTAYGGMQISHGLRSASPREDVLTAASRSIIKCSVNALWPVTSVASRKTEVDAQYDWNLRFDFDLSTDTRVAGLLGVLYDVSYSTRQVLSIAGTDSYDDFLFLSEDGNEVFHYCILGRDIAVFDCLADAMETFFFTRRWDQTRSITRLFVPDNFQWPEDVRSRIPGP